MKVRSRGLGVVLSGFLTLASLQVISCLHSPAVPNSIVFSCESDPKPPRVGLNTFTVTLTSNTGQPPAGARVSLEGDMSHAGMSPVFGEAKEIGPGRYQGTLDLNMRGDWTVLFHIKLAGGETFDRQVDIRNIRST